MDTLIPRSNWLEDISDPRLSQMNLTQTSLNSNSLGQVSYSPDHQTAILQYYYYPQYPTVNYTLPIRPVKLTLSEVEKLRKIAKTDDKLKAILMKFTDLIEITVNFD